MDFQAELLRVAFVFRLTSMISYTWENSTAAPLSASPILPMSDSVIFVDLLSHNACITGPQRQAKLANVGPTEGAKHRRRSL